MEAVVGGVISRAVPCFSSAAGIDAQSQYSHDSSSLCVGSRRMFNRKTRKVAGLSGHCFRDKDHLEYYSSLVGGKIKYKKLDKAAKKEKIKDEHKETQKMMKKILKVMLEEGLSRRDWSMFSSRHDPDNLLFDQLKAKTTSEATEVLQGQFQRLMREDRQLKKIRRKNEEIRLKMQDTSKCEISSSSSSESSDSDCGEVVDVSKNCLNLAQTVLKSVIEHESLDLPGIWEEERVVSTATEGGNLPAGDCVETSTGSLQQGCCFGTGGFCSSGHVDNVRSTNTNSTVEGASTKKFEVCMGGKCKKSGAAVLLGEFQRLVGGAVSGCKCMGKCRDGPNVRILNDPVQPAANPLRIGVRLEDVDLIVANFTEESSELGLAAAS